ncbi:hypothetical protein BH11ACT3_BH11ACT3_20190 [soil metagenome]
MSAEDLASSLLQKAIEREQVAHRIRSDDDVEAIREAVRQGARARDVRIRTAVIDDVLVVVLADAAIWDDTTATMREKLTP